MKSNIDHTWLDTIEFLISELSIAITARRLDLIDELENLYKTELNNNSLTEYFPSADIVISGKIESLLIEKPAADVEDYIKAELKKSRKVSNSLTILTRVPLVFGALEMS